MNTPTILLYNLDNPRGPKSAVCACPCACAPPWCPGSPTACPWGAGGGPSRRPLRRGRLDDEMLLIVNCPGSLLDLFLQAFRRQKLAPVRLKAVLTPTNREWDSVALHAELCRERQAIAEGQAAHRKGPAGE
ncbi:MAG: DUF3783 domain-containing protein [Flavonifractor plautii]